MNQEQIDLQLRQTPPEDMDFVPGQVYYVKRKGVDEIEPLMCIHPNAGIVRYTGEGPIPAGNLNGCMENQIEFVITGIPDEILHKANQIRAWGRE